MRTRDGRGPQRKAPGVEAGGGAKALGGLSEPERSTRPGGWVPLRARLAPAYMSAPWGFDLEARKAELLRAVVDGPSETREAAPVTP